MPSEYSRKAQIITRGSLSHRKRRSSENSMLSSCGPARSRSGDPVRCLCAPGSLPSWDLQCLGFVNSRNRFKALQRYQYLIHAPGSSLLSGWGVGRSGLCVGALSGCRVMNSAWGGCPCPRFPIFFAAVRLKSQPEQGSHVIRLKVHRGIGRLLTGSMLRTFSLGRGTPLRSPKGRQLSWIRPVNGSAIET